MPKPLKETATGDLAAEWASPTSLRPWTRNPKPIAPKDVREMCRSIRRFGFGAPIVARREDAEIIEGHLRHQAAMRLGLDRVPVRYLDISAAEAHMLALAAIKFEGRRETDDEQIGSILGELEERGVDLTAGTAFDDAEIDRLLGESLETADAKTRTKRGRMIDRAMRYSLVVECESDEHQARLLDELEAKGLRCKPLMS